MNFQISGWFFVPSLSTSRQIYTSWGLVFFSRYSWSSHTEPQKPGGPWMLTGHGRFQRHFYSSGRWSQLDERITTHSDLRRLEERGNNWGNRSVDPAGWLGYFRGWNILLGCVGIIVRITNQYNLLESNNIAWDNVSAANYRTWFPPDRDVWWTMSTSKCFWPSSMDGCQQVGLFNIHPEGLQNRKSSTGPWILPELLTSLQKNTQCMSWSIF